MKSDTAEVQSNRMLLVKETCKVKGLLKLKKKPQLFVPIKKIEETEVNWFEASAICRTMNGSLASIENERIMEAIDQHLAPEKPADPWWWLSGNDLASEGNFVWANTGQPMNYTLWSTGQPNHFKDNEHCVNLWVSGGLFTMNDLDCKRHNFFICERDY
uniref:C-type lectin domain-containing protein n=1 Tax=Glossina brevipalpis TaxID=37001 RepID=A0A1A9WW81_9MUSC